MTSRIEQIISEIEEYVDSCKFQPLSNTKIIVNKEELEELLTELRMKTPDEIKRYIKTYLLMPSYISSYFLSIFSVLSTMHSDALPA